MMTPHALDALKRKADYLERLAWQVDPSTWSGVEQRHTYMAEWHELAATIRRYDPSFGPSAP